jgi:hypothetical protein
MLNTTTLSDIENNINTGVEYEIALFAKLIEKNNADYPKVINSIQKRHDSSKVMQIMGQTDIQIILNELKKKNLTLKDATFETQNDEIGPADIVMIVKDSNNNESKIGLSVKYANTCTLNSTSGRFITTEQRKEIEGLYPSYKRRFIEYMRNNFGNAYNWHRKRCPITNEFIDVLRDAVINNWNKRKDKKEVLSAAFQDNSPIPFWVVTYGAHGYSLNNSPVCINLSRSNEVIASKHSGQYVTFSLDGRVYAKMQVKFNNGLLELNYDHKGKRKRETPSEIIDGIEFIDGDPFGSWNFSVVK